MDPDNWDQICSNGLTINLSYPPEIILERASRNKDRPLLNQDTREEKLKTIETLLENRQAYYRKADLILHFNREIDANLVADMIAGYLGVWQ